MKQLQPSNPNPDLMPTAYVALENGERLPVVGISPCGATRCACCGQRGVGVFGSYLWHQEKEALITRYMMCGSCVRQFKESGPFQERFLNMLLREAPAVRPEMVKNLPRLISGVVQTDHGAREAYLLRNSEEGGSDETTG